MNCFRKIIPVIFFGLLFAGCVNDVSGPSTTPSVSGAGETGGSANPKPCDSRNENLDLLFGLDEEAELTVNISRDEWNKMLMYYSWWTMNEEYVQANCEFSKKGYTWKVPSIGFRIRGNTSRKCPQNVSFSQKNGFGPGNNNYQQPHFKISFEEYLSGDDEYKMANCISGLMLKRFKSDPTYAREVYGYNFFRQSGIWDAPRAGYCHLTVRIAEKDGSVEAVDFGTYAMIEQIDKQFLKARTQKQLKSETEGFVSNDGNLWKCTWGANLGLNYLSMDTERKAFNEFTWSDDIISTANPGIKTNVSSNTDDSGSEETSWIQYDLKTNKKSLDSAKSELLSLITSLNALSDTDQDAIKEWYKNNMDIDLFLKTYACNVALGMWDDYWGDGGNNWYFYIDRDSGGNTGKAYFIPYDYDNILGVNWSNIDWANKNPFEWTINKLPAPLIEKALKVDEFKEKYGKYLLEVTAGTTWFNPVTASEKICGWHTMIQNKISSSYLLYPDTSASFGDYPDTASWANPYKAYKIYTDTTDSDLNYFVVRRNCIDNYANNRAASVTFYAADGTTVLQTCTDAAQGTSLSALYTASEPSVSGGKLAYWKDEYGNAADTVSGYNLKFYPEFVYKAKLPVTVNNDGSVTVIFRPEDYSLSSCWMTVQGKSRSKTASEIEKVSIRGQFAENSGNFNSYWNTYNQIDLTENPDGTYSYTFEKNKYCYENASDPDGGTCFKFIITWKDENCPYTENETEWVKNEESGNWEEVLKESHAYTNDYTWMNYSDKTYALPENCKFRWDGEDGDDFKYVLKNLVSLYNSIN